jgi:hypothetical protein
MQSLERTVCDVICHHRVPSSFHYAVLFRDAPLLGGARRWRRLFSLQVCVLTDPIRFAADEMTFDSELSGSYPTQGVDVLCSALHTKTSTVTTRQGEQETRLDDSWFTYAKHVFQRTPALWPTKRAM